MTRALSERVLASRPVRFLLAGAVNTVVTFLLYLALLGVVAYPVAYSAAFGTGIVIAYVLNRGFVFRSAGSLRAMLLFPLVYVLQYLLGLAVVVIWVDVLALPEALASLAAVVVTIPVTYALSRLIFTGRDRAAPDEVPGPGAAASPGDVVPPPRVRGSESR
jgi:putative flippase GtrA